MKHYFAYGSNMAVSRLEARVGPVEVLGAARLVSHALRYHKLGRDGSGKCDAFHTGRDGDCLYGVVFALEVSQLEGLDRFEGRGYRRKEVSVEMLAAGCSSLAETYVALESAIAPRLKPYDWYHGFVVAGAEAQGLPLEYLEGLRRVETTVDADERRRAGNEAIAAGLDLRPSRSHETAR